MYKIFKIIKDIINYDIKNDLIYTMTFREFEKKYQTIYNDIYRKVYYFEFNNSTVDKPSFREKLVEELKT